MKKMMIAAAVAGMLAVWPARAGSAVEPSSCAVTNVRGEAASFLSAGTLYQGQSLRLTNCAACLGSTASPQWLTNVTVLVSVGNLSTNIDYTATVNDAAAGLWSCTIVVPALSSFLIETKVTDANTNSYIYAPKTLVAEQSMF